jgi:hypothetical protein
MTTPEVSNSQLQQRIYDLLPTLFRERDKEIGGPLQRLLEVIDEQMASVEVDIAQLYDDMFLETCQGPLIDRFAELLGVHLEPLRPAPGDTGVDAAAWVSRRHQVLNAVAARAAKGTLAALERIATDVTGWPVRAVERGTLVTTTQPLRYPVEPRHGTLLDIRHDAALLALGTAFSSASALPDVRRGNSVRTKPVGPNPATVAVTAWRQEVAHVHRAPARCLYDDNRYSFDPLGYEQQLSVAPTPRRAGTAPAGDLDLPVPISRRGLRRHLTDYYGPDRSLCVFRGRSPVPAEHIVVADLSRWARSPDWNQVAVDPETGRISLPPDDDSDEGVWVRYHHLGVGPLGAGTTATLTDDAADCGCGTPTEHHRFPVSADESDDKTAVTSLNAALYQWMAIVQTGKPVHGVIEILDSSVYEEDFDIRIPAGSRLEIRAADGQRPVLRSMDEQHNRPQRVRVEGYSLKDHDRPAEFRLVGITVGAHALELRGEFGDVEIDHCTIVPGRHDESRDHRHVALAISAIPCELTVTSSVIGWIRVAADEVGNDPVGIAVCDSIIDGGPRGAHAIGGVEDRPGYARLALARATVLGEINVFATSEVSDSIITGRFHSQQRQSGVISYCYVQPGSHVPRRVGCQPETAVYEASDAKGGGLSPAEEEAIRARVRPRFDSTRFGGPGYGRLSLDAAPELTAGGHDEGELGAFHSQWITRRMNDMAVLLAEFTPIDVDLDIMFAT